MMKLKVGDLLRRVLPAFEKVPTELFSEAGLSYNELANCDVHSIEIVYSLDELPPGYMVDVSIHPMVDGSKVTLVEKLEIEYRGEKNGVPATDRDAREGETAEVLST